MADYSNNNSKTIIQRYLKVFLIFIAVCFIAAILYFTGASKYLLGSLLNGWPISSSASTNYVYGENIGWVDFNPADFTTGVGVRVGDNGLTGYAYGENVGWIKLGNDSGPDSTNGYLNTSSSNWGVNNSNGTLSGYAYGENVGWISFSGTGYGVTINTSTGAFSGYAYGENVGWISFSGSGYGVTTDWRPAPITVSVSGVTLNESAHTLAIGATDQLVATVAPSNATNTSVTWSSSNASVATVSNSGLVTAVSAGSATITVTTTDGSHTATDAITVSAPAATGGGGGGSGYGLSTPITSPTPAPTSSQANSDILNYVSQALKNIQLFITNGSPSFVKPITKPPVGLQLTQPPPGQTTTTTTTNNKGAIIQVMQKLLKALTDLLGMVTK